MLRINFRSVAEKLCAISGQAPAQSAGRRAQHGAGSFQHPDRGDSRAAPTAGRRRRRSGDRAGGAPLRKADGCQRPRHGVAAVEFRSDRLYPGRDQTGLRHQPDQLHERQRNGHGQRSGRNDRHRRCLRRSEHRQRPAPVRRRLRLAGSDARPRSIETGGTSLARRQHRLGHEIVARRRVGARHRARGQHPAGRGQQLLATAIC